MNLDEIIKITKEMGIEIRNDNSGVHYIGDKPVKSLQDIMNLDGYVYCTNCRYFRLCDENLPYCMYENKCNINDCEDSKSPKERPYYEPR